jgi:hypothetical protein
MRANGRVVVALGFLCGLPGCFAIKLPDKIVVQGGNQGKSSRPASTPAPCDLSDLPNPPPDGRPPLAVLDFQVGQSMEADVGRALADLCRDAIQESGRFSLVDRERIADILGERDFADAMQCDNTVCLVRYGELLGAERMMQGRINRLGDVFVLAVGLTDVDTGEQIARSASLASIEESTGAVPDLVCQILRNASTEDR